MRPIYTFRNFIFLFVFLFAFLNGYSQCSITSSRNTTGLSCGSSPLSSCGGVLTIGDGTNAMTLTMTSNLNLTCLGPIRFVIKNGASVDFSSGNYDLQLAAGSSIEIENGGQLGASSNCSASDLVKIGSVNVASCNGSGNGVLTSFPGLVANGGYSSVNATASPSTFCNSVSPTLSATANPSSGATLKWYDAQTGGNLLYTGATYSPGTITTTKTYYVEAVYSGYTTVRKSVTVTANQTPTSLSYTNSSQTYCVGASIAANTVTLSPSAATGITYTVSPALPSGLSLNATTGEISGTPSVSSSATNYTVTASNTCGNTTTVLSIAVNTNSVAPTSVTGTTAICSGSSTTLTVNGGTIGTGAVAKWYSGSCGGTLVGSGSSVTVSPTSTTTYYVRYEGTCNTTTCASATVTVNPLPSAAGTISGSSSVCVGAASVAYSVPSITNATSYSWTYTGTGVTISGTSNSVTVNFASNATSGNLTVYGVNSCGNGVVSAAFAIAVNNLPNTPIAGTPTNPTCTMPTGSVALSGLPTSGTIIQTGTKYETYTISGSGSQVISSLLPGTYYFSVSNGTCESSTVQVDIIAPETNTWSNGAWSKGTPTINQRLVFASDYTNANDVDLIGCSCQVTGTTKVTIKSGRTMKIENGIEVMPNASLTFENNASLVQINDLAVNTGNINYHRHTAAVRRYDYTYWSSPVAPQTLKNLSPNTFFDKYFSYDNGWRVIKYGAENMVKGKGYIIRAPQSFSLTVAAVDTNPVFVGVPNNGEYPIPVVTNQTYLLGNPYPSAIDADKLLELNAGLLEGTLYFWTHNTLPATGVPGGDATYSYTVSDYASYNRTGGVGTVTKSAAFSGGNVPTGKIAAGQGFFAPAKASGNVVFNNSMRVEGGASGANNSQFFKLSSTTKTSVSTVEKSRIWLNLSNKQGAFKQMLVGYIKGATNDYDSGYDGVTYDGNQYVDFYSVNQASKYVIQGRALPFVKKDTVVLGYKSTIVGEFQISIDHADGVLETQNVFLEDKTLNVLHNLKNGSYTFTTEKGVFNDRFVLRYVDKNAVEEVVETPTPNDGVSNGGNEISSSIVIYSKDKLITVKSPEVDVQKIVVYDSTGKLLYANENVAVAQFTITQQLASDQVLLVDVLLANGTKVSRKVIY